MQELLVECVRIVNLPYSILFVLTLLYWILYIAGVLGSDFLDFLDFDVEVGEGVEAGVEGLDGDFDLEVEHHGAGALASVMKFVHGGDVPVTIIASTLTMCMWVTSVLANYYMKNNNPLMALAMFIPVFVVGMVATKIVLLPFVPVLRHAFDESGDSIKIIGKPCVVSSLEVTSKYGQAEVATKGAPLAIHVKTVDGETLKKGDEAVVFDRDKEDDTYLVTKFDLGAGLSTRRS